MIAVASIGEAESGTRSTPPHFCLRTLPPAVPAAWIRRIPLIWSQQLAVTVDIAVVLHHYANDAPCSA